MKFQLSLTTIISFIIFFSFSELNAQQGKGKATGKTKVEEQVRGKSDQARNKVKELSEETGEAMEDAENEIEEAEQKIKGKDKYKKNKGKVKRDKKDEEKDKDGNLDDDRVIEKKEERTKKDGAKKGKAHAYGKNKGELKGKEFGQSRAAIAKSQNEEKKSKIKDSVRTNEDKVRNAKSKIAEARIKAESARKNGDISDEAYQDKMEKLKKAEEVTAKLEAALARGKINIE